MPKGEKSSKTFDDSDDVRKAFLSRIPQEIDEPTLKVLLESQFSTELEELSIVKDNSVSEKEAAKEHRSDAIASALEDVLSDGPKKKAKKEKLQKGDRHLGYGYVTFSDEETAKAAIAAGVIRTARKHNIHIQAVRRVPKDRDEGADDDGDDKAAKGQCFLWARFACSHGDKCVFSHEGPGGALVRGKGKCLDWVRKGKCKKGDACEFDHDESKKGAAKRKREDEANADGSESAAAPKKRDDKEKDCIEWKTKGKCRKGEQCTYKHDELLGQKALAKKAAKASAASSAASSSVKAIPKRPDDCCTLKIFGLTNATLKRRDVEAVLKQASVQHARHVRIPEGIDADTKAVELEFKSGKSCEDAMIVLSNDNFAKLFGKNIRGGNVARVRVEY